MPIKIPNKLPAAEVLRQENIFIMDQKRAMQQDIRPLAILILNLMPTKIATETQLARLLGNTPLQIEMELIAVSGHVPKNTSQEHYKGLTYEYMEDYSNEAYNIYVELKGESQCMGKDENGNWIHYDCDDCPNKDVC